MKTFVLVFTLLCALLVSANHKDPAYWRMVRKGVEAKIVLTVVDDLGSPVPDAAVHAIFSRTNDLDPLDGKTDVHGKCEFQHLTNGNRLEFFISKDGYYGSQIQFSLIKMGAEHKIEKDQWQPCPIDKRISLRRKLKPLLIKHGTLLDVPKTNTWIGVDLEKSALVSPYGNGTVTDFEVYVAWDCLTPPKSQFCRADFRFTEQMSGGYFAKGVIESEYPYSYAARRYFRPLKSISIINRNGGPHIGQKLFQEDEEFIIRTRCILDENGKVKAANYGAVRVLRVSPGWEGKATLRLGYVFNPTPNDTNLEPKK